MLLLQCMRSKITKKLMETKYKYLLFGTLIGVFLSGLMVVLIGTRSNRQQTSKSSNLIFSNSSPLVDPVTCINPSTEIDPTTPKLDINLSSLEEFTSLPGIGEVKAKNIIDFREKYGNFIFIDELLYVPGIGESLFQQICNLVFVNSKEEK